MGGATLSSWPWTPGSSPRPLTSFNSFAIVSLTILIAGVFIAHICLLTWSPTPLSITLQLHTTSASLRQPVLPVYQSAIASILIRCDSRSRQAPSNNPVLFAVLRLVPLQNQLPYPPDRTLRSHQKAIWPHTESFKARKECRALQSGCRGCG